MSTVIKAGVALAALVAILSLIVAFAGLHKSDPMTAQFAFIIPAMILNVGAIVWALRKSAATSGYLKQLGSGLLIGVVASVLIFGFSYLMTTALMPGYLDECREAMLVWLKTADMGEAERAKQVASVQATTPVSQALAGVAGTMGTSALTAVIAAIFLRRRA